MPSEATLCMASAFLLRGLALRVAGWGSVFTGPATSAGPSISGDTTGCRLATICGSGPWGETKLLASASLVAIGAGACLMRGDWAFRSARQWDTNAPSRNRLSGQGQAGGTCAVKRRKGVKRTNNHKPSRFNRANTAKAGQRPSATSNKLPTPTPIKPPLAPSNWGAHSGTELYQTKVPACMLSNHNSAPTMASTLQNPARSPSIKTAPRISKLIAKSGAVQPIMPVNQGNPWRNGSLLGTSVSSAKPPAKKISKPTSSMLKFSCSSAHQVVSGRCVDFRVMPCMI